MAAGDLITQDYQYEYNNWVGGAATDFLVERIQGMFAMGDVETNQSYGGEDRGSYMGPTKEIGKTITFDVVVMSLNQMDMEDKMDFLGSVFELNQATLPLIAKRPAKVKRRIDVQARRQNFDSNYEMARGNARGSVELWAPDPRWYSVDEYTQSADIIAGQSSSTTTVFSAGFTNSKFGRLQITGPTTNPRITNAADSNRTIRIDVVMSSSDVLDIDLRHKTVLLNGVDVYKQVVRRDNQWWVFKPGNNPITYNRSGTTGNSNFDIWWHDAWNNA